LITGHSYLSLGASSQEVTRLATLVYKVNTIGNRKVNINNNLGPAARDYKVSQLSRHRRFQENLSAINSQTTTRPGKLAVLVTIQSVRERLI